MSKRRDQRPRGRGSKQFLMLTMDLIRHSNYRALSPRAVKLLIDVGSFYSGFNNGDLAVTSKVMKGCGWSSNDQLRKALDELLYYEFLIKTRQGGRNHCSLYAIAWEPIDHCKGKHDVAETNKGSDAWKKPKEKYHRKDVQGRGAVFVKSERRTVAPIPVKNEI